MAKPNDSSSTFEEKRYIAWRSGASSTTTSMNNSPCGAGPMMRMTPSPRSSIIENESTIADHTFMVRMSMSRTTAGGMSATASRRRCCPVLIATARAPMLCKISRASKSGTIPAGAASSTSAAVLAAAIRSFRRLTLKLAIEGT